VTSRPPEILDAPPATLRRWRIDDLDEAFQATWDSHDHLRPWMPWAEIISREGTRSFLVESLTGWDNGTEFNYAITVDDRIVGSAGLMTRRGPGGLEIGYWVHHAYTRRGLATAAARALTEAAFALPGITHVEIVHDELNVASGAVPRKLGYTRVGTCQMDNPPSAGTGIGVVWRIDSPRRPAMELYAVTDELM
jgi:ribosomal-protein-serine acetyltransferase